MNPKLHAWLRQPTTIHGIGVVVATSAGIGTFYATGNAAAAVGLAGTTFGAVATLMNDASTDKSRVEALVSDAITAIATRRLGPMLPELAADTSLALQPLATAANAPATPPSTV